MLSMTPAYCEYAWERDPLQTFSESPGSVLKHLPSHPLVLPHSGISSLRNKTLGFLARAFLRGHQCPRDKTTPDESGFSAPLTGRCWCSPATSSAGAVGVRQNRSLIHAK